MYPPQTRSIKNMFWLAVHLLTASQAVCGAERPKTLLFAQTSADGDHPITRHRDNHITSPQN